MDIGYSMIIISSRRETELLSTTTSSDLSTDVSILLSIQSDHDYAVTPSEEIINFSENEIGLNNLSISQFKVWNHLI